MPTILVTGANGFVGRCLCSELVRRGYGVRAAVRELSRAGALRGDVIAVGALGPATQWQCALENIDAVVHLAARVHVMTETSADPLEAFRAINVRATEMLAQAAAAQGVKRFVFVSSIKVNGEENGVKAYTPDDPPAPSDPYGISKLEAEQLLMRVAESTEMEVMLVRPPLVYGPGVGGNFLRLLKLVSRGFPLPFGAVHNRRSMIYNGNLAYALIECALHPNAAGKTYLVSDGEDLSTSELVRRLAAALRRTARLLPVPAVMLRLAGAVTGRTAEIDRLVGSLRVDSSRMRSDLGWTPPFSVDEGIAETVRWFAETRP